MNRQSELYQVFEKENLILARAKEVVTQAQQDGAGADPMCAEYELLTKSYAQLLADVKLLTSVSDRLQARIDKARLQTSRRDDELEQVQAKLARSQAGERAFMMVMLLAALFFVVSEWAIDPPLAHQSGVLGGQAAVVLKLAVAVALYPVARWFQNNLQKTTVNKVN
jgi:hypothetical protein